MAAKKIGTLLNQYFKARAKRLAADREAAKLKSAEAAIGDAVRAAMNAEKTEKAACAAGSVSLKQLEVPRVEDWDAFYGFVHKQKAAHLLFRRVNEANIGEMLEHDAKLAKAGIPGIRFEPVQKMTATATRG